MPVATSAPPASCRQASPSTRPMASYNSCNPHVHHRCYPRNSDHAATTHSRCAESPRTITRRPLTSSILVTSFNFQNTICHYYITTTAQTARAVWTNFCGLRGSFLAAMSSSSFSMLTPVLRKPWSFQSRIPADALVARLQRVARRRPHLKLHGDTPQCYSSGDTVSTRPTHSPSAALPHHRLPPRFRSA